MARVKPAALVVKFICDIDPDEPAPGCSVETPSELEALAAAGSGVATVLLTADSLGEMEAAQARLNRLNSGQKSAILYAGSPAYNEALGKWENLAFLRELTPEEEIRKPRKKFGFI